MELEKELGMLLAEELVKQTLFLNSLNLEELILTSILN